MDTQGNQKKNCSVEFYHKCTGNNLKATEIRFKEDGSYFPRSGLLEDIRNITRKSSQVLVIFQKKLSDKAAYQNVRYVAKGLDVSKLKLPLEIAEQVCISAKK